jgi:hypothetical protein
MNPLPRFATAALVALILAGLAVPNAHAVTILDSYTSDIGVPTGTSYVAEIFYDQYVDAGSVDASPFVLTRTTTANPGGILFYGSTELISEGDANTFRLTSTTGVFDFTSFHLLDLEMNSPYVYDPENDSYGPDPDAIQTLTITSSLGQTQTWSSYGNEGVKTMNWSGVDWVDFTSQYTKAKVASFEVTAVPSPSSVPEIDPNSLGSVLALVLGSLGLLERRRLKAA